MIKSKNAKSLLFLILLSSILVIISGSFLVSAGVVINSPLNNSQLLNTLTTTLNVTNTVGFNSSIIYSSNNGITNYTLCTSCTSPNYTTLTFSRQGFFNLSVWAFNSTGSINSNISYNIFVGNRTQFNALDNGGIDKFCKNGVCYDNSTSLNSGNNGSVNGVRPFIYFNLTSLENNANIGLYEANISLFMYDDSGGIGARNHIFYSITSSWNETDNSIPTNNSIISNTVSINYGTSFYKRYYWNVYTIYNNIINGTLTNYGITLYSAESTNSVVRNFRPSENSTESPYLNLTYYTINTAPNIPTLITPSNTSSQLFNNSVLFNWTDIDQDSDNLTYFVFMDTNPNPTTLINTTYNSTSGSYNIFNYTNPSGFADGVYYWKVYAYDGINNQNVSSAIYSFDIDANGATISLISPSSSRFFNSGLDIYFNWSAIAFKGLDTCELWGDWTGTWERNYSWINPTNNTMNWTSLNISNDGNYIWNIWCNDTLNVIKSSTNRTFTIDTTFPIINITGITTTSGSQTISFAFTSSDINQDTCKYSIFNSSGGIDGVNNNISVTCNSSGNSATTSAYGTYNLTVYVVDKAGNENSSTKAFLTNSSGGGVIIIGGGGGSPAYQSILASNFSLLSSGGNIMDIVLAKNSVRPREKFFTIISKERETFDAELSCDATNLDENQTRETTPGINICDYVMLENSKIRISPNEDSPTVGKLMVYTPKDAKIGDKYYFNLILTRTSKDNSTAVYSKLSVSTRVTWWAVFFYKWRYFEDLPLINSLFTDKQDSDKVAFPVLGVSIVLFIISFMTILISNSIIFKKKYPVTGFIIGLIISATIFVLFSIYS